MSSAIEIIGNEFDIVVHSLSINLEQWEKDWLLAKAEKFQRNKERVKSLLALKEAGQKDQVITRLKKQKLILEAKRQGYQIWRGSTLVLLDADSAARMVEENDVTDYEFLQEVPRADPVEIVALEENAARGLIESRDWRAWQNNVLAQVTDVELTQSNVTIISKELLFLQTSIERMIRFPNLTNAWTLRKAEYLSYLPHARLRLNFILDFIESLIKEARNFIPFCNLSEEDKFYASLFLNAFAFSQGF